MGLRLGDVVPTPSLPETCQKVILYGRVPWEGHIERARGTAPVTPLFLTVLTLVAKHGERQHLSELTNLELVTSVLDNCCLDQQAK